MFTLFWIARKLFRVVSISEKVIERKLQWFGHVRKSNWSRVLLTFLAKAICAESPMHPFMSLHLIFFQRLICVQLEKLKVKLFLSILGIGTYKKGIFLTFDQAFLALSSRNAASV